MNQERQWLEMLTHWAECYGHEVVDDFVRWVYEQYGMVPLKKPVDPV